MPITRTTTMIGRNPASWRNGVTASIRGSSRCQSESPDALTRPPLGGEAPRPRGGADRWAARGSRGTPWGGLGGFGQLRNEVIGYCPTQPRQSQRTGRRCSGDRDGGQPEYL